MLAQGLIGRIFTGHRRSSHVAGSTGSLPRAWLTSVSRAVNWPRERVARKVVLPFAFLALVLGALVTYMATELVAGNLAERFDNQLLEASRATADAVARKEQHHLEIVRAVAFTRGLPEATLAGDSTAIGELVAGQAANVRVERLEILGSSGERIKSIELVNGESVAYRDISDADQPATWALVHDTLLQSGDQVGSKFSQIVPTGSGVFVFTAGPITLEGRIVGAALVGTSLSTFLSEARSQAMADVTLYDRDGSVLGTTFAGGDESREEHLGLALDEQALAGVAASNNVLREHREISGRGYDFIVANLALRGEDAGFYSIALPTDFMFSAVNATRWQVGLIFGLGMAAVLGIGLFLSRTITTPILALARTADAVTRGDFTRRTRVTSVDEVGHLTQRMNQMTDRLEGQYLGTLRTLASAVTSRDSHTLAHSLRVGQLAALLGRRLGLDDRTIAYLEVAGYLHDIGGVGVRSKRLRWEDISPAERRLVEEHPHLELTVVEDPGILEKAPFQLLAGNSDPRLSRESDPGVHLAALMSKIVPVADMFDALTGDWDERSPVAIDEAIAAVRSEGGTALHFGTVEKLAEIASEWEEHLAGLEANQRQRPDGVGERP
jgi:HAMP domain-containing protein